MNYRTVDLGRDFPGKITNFAEARNSFLKDGWIFFLDSDEEVTESFWKALDELQPDQPYYWVRRVNLYKGQYSSYCNPDFKPALVSPKVQFVGALHERIVPKRPHGIIEIPIVHNHTGPDSYVNPPQRFPRLTRLWQGAKKGVEVARGR